MQSRSGDSVNVSGGHRARVPAIAWPSGCIPREDRRAQSKERAMDDWLSYSVAVCVVLLFMILTGIWPAG
jgi:hypothetical protein